MSEDANHPIGETISLHELQRMSREIPRSLQALMGFGAAAVVLALAVVFVANETLDRPFVWLPISALFAAGLMSFFFVMVQLMVLNRRTLQDAIIRTTGNAIEENREVVEAAAERIVTASTHTWQPQGLLLGCRIGRGAVSCGVIRITHAEGADLPRASSYRELEGTVTRPMSSTATTQERLRAAAELIGAAVCAVHSANPGDRVEGIGIGVPGFVGVADKKVEFAVAGLPDYLNVVQVIVDSLLESDAVRGRLGSDARDVAAMCYLDNDVRCATRRVLSKHIDDKRWTNFACLHIGTGVGAGIVFDQKLYYGSRFWAGEIGHIDLSVSPGLSVEIGGRSMRALRCSCGKEGFHFESMVNYEGLSVLGRRIDRERYDSIKAAALSETDGGWTDDRFKHDSWPLVVGSTGKARELPPALRSLLDEPGYSKYLKAVLGMYVAIVAGGLSIFANVLDVDRVVLFGSLAEKLHEHTFFDAELRTSMTRRLRPRPDVERDYARASSDVWQGAALLCRDAGYLSVRGGNEIDLTNREVEPSPSDIIPA